MPYLAQIAVVLAVTVAEPAFADSRESDRIDGEERWLLVESGKAMKRIGFDSTHPGLSQAEKITLPNSLLVELRPLLETIAGLEPSGVAPREPSQELPRPWWEFYRLDVDGDGRTELVLTGGVDPTRFYAVLKQTRRAWHILHHRAYELLGMGKYGAHLYLFGGFDGYGVANPVLVVDRIALARTASGTPEHLLGFEMLAEELGNAEPGAPPYACTVARASELRSAPRVDNAPMDRGFGIDFPGNIVQVLAPGSSGWALGRTTTADGKQWLLCGFTGKVPWLDPEPAAHEVLVPKKLVSKPLRTPQTLIVGWIAERDLSRWVGR